MTQAGGELLAGWLSDHIPRGRAGASKGVLIARFLAPGGAVGRHCAPGSASRHQKEGGGASLSCHLEALTTISYPKIFNFRKT